MTWKYNVVHGKQKRVGIACDKHGYFSSPECPLCATATTGVPFGIKTDSWVTGWWEHIDKNPMYIRDKSHLIQECEKRGVLAKAFMKPHSQERKLVHA